MKKRIFWLVVMLFLAMTAAYAQESLTISTYYPSPYGVYGTLRLYPSDSNTPGSLCANAGEMYFDQSDAKLYVCSGSPLQWREPGSTTFLPGAVCGAYWLWQDGEDHGTPVSVPCLGVDLGTGCPTGFTRIGGKFKDSYTQHKHTFYVCVKN
jgi:hypothetical protein